MAATHFTRTTIFNFSRITSISRLPVPHKASRVCFTSASKHSQGKHASESTNNGYDGDESISYSGGKSSERNKWEDGKEKVKTGAGEMKDVPMDGMKEANEKIKEKSSDMAGRASDRAGDVKDKANDISGRAVDRAGEVKEKAKETGWEMKESVEETASVAADKAEEGRSKAAEMAKAAKDKTMGAAEAVAEKTKQTVAGAWDAAKGTSEKIKESVVGTSSDDDDEWGDDQRKGKARKVVDEDVDDLRRRVGNLDHEKKDY